MVRSSRDFTFAAWGFVGLAAISLFGASIIPTMTLLVISVMFDCTAGIIKAIERLSPERGKVEA